MNRVPVIYKTSAASDLETTARGLLEEARALAIQTDTPMVWLDCLEGALKRLDDDRYAVRERVQHLVRNEGE